LAPELGRESQQLTISQDLTMTATIQKEMSKDNAIKSQINVHTHTHTHIYLNSLRETCTLPSLREVKL
jgi:hypothetical protein